jgi:Tol biopolymer transport system component
MTLPGNSTTAVTPVPSRRFNPWILFPVLALVAAAGIFLWKRGAGTVTVPVDSSLDVAFQQLTDEQGVEERASLSPDGKTIAYQVGPFGKRDIFLRRVGGRNPVNLTESHEGDDIEAAFSPDGNLIAFRSSRNGGGIYLMGATGESVRRLTDFGYSPSWSPDGKKIVCGTEGVIDIMARSTTSQLWIIDVETGAKKLLYKGDAVHPQWSPHGSRIAFWGLSGEGGQRDISSIPANGGEAVKLTTNPAVDWNPIWSPDGKFIYFSSSRGGSLNLWRVAVDETSGNPTADPMPVTTPSLWSGFVSISQDGKHLAYTALERRSNIQKFAFDPETETVSASPIPVTQGSKVYDFPEVSPDGQWVTFRSVGSQEDIYVCRSDGTDLRKLTDDPFRDRGPSWSPDGKQLAGAGVLLADVSTAPGIIIYSWESKQYLILKNIIPEMRQSVVRDVVLWMNDNRRLLAINGGSMYVVDVPAKKARLVYDSPGLYWLSLSKDNRWIYVSQQADEDDIWLATLK